MATVVVNPRVDARPLLVQLEKPRVQTQASETVSSTSTAVDYYEGLQESPKSKALSSRSRLTKDSAKLVLVLVGLPGRGKSYISAKLYSFLSWQGYRCRVFNVGQHRRKTNKDVSRASFFDTSNGSAKQLREKLAMEVLDAAVDWLSNDQGEIALFDATNSTRARRRSIVARCPYTIVYVESICDDKDVLEQNLLTKVKNSPDFKGLSREAALADLKLRIQNYESAYETVDDVEGAFVKLFNFSSKVTAKDCFGRMSKVVVPFLMAVHANDRPIFVTALTPKKSEPEFLDQDLDIADFEARLAKWWWKRGNTSLSVYTSTMPLAISAGIALGKPDPDLVTITHTSALNPLLLGDHAPTDVRDRGDGGESYLDLVHRLESVVLDLEASVDPVLLVTHATPARVLRAYFQNIDVGEVLGETSSNETKALADSAPAVLELRPKIGGGFQESVHWL